MFKGPAKLCGLHASNLHEASSAITVIMLYWVNKDIPSHLSTG